MAKQAWLDEDAESLLKGDTVEELIKLHAFASKSHSGLLDSRCW